MTKMKFKKQERMTRSEAADLLAELAKSLRHSGKMEMERGGEKLDLELDVPEDVMLEFEVEMEEGETELEVEIKWAPVSGEQMHTAPDA